jgi:hypothetical protein
MGLTGALLAWWLERWDCDWTWHDTETAVNAWQASTGAIFPAGARGSVDRTTFDNWTKWLHGPAIYPRRFFEPANYWFNHKHPPHGGYDDCQAIGRHGLQRSSLLSYHLNAQAFVLATRKKFAKQRLPSAAFSADVAVVAHGFGKRLHHVVWGWTVPVELDFPVYMADSYRPCLYLREGRFVMAYAYPMPGTDPQTWYAGSSLIHQREPRPLEVMPKFERWRRLVKTLSRGAVKVLSHGKPRQGWRPAEAEPHCAPRVKRRGNMLEVPPLWHSGIRWFPAVLEQLEREMRRAR